MVVLGDEAQLDASFGPFGDSPNLDARLVNGLCRTYQRLKNHLGRTLMVLLGDEAQLEARFGPFGDSANLDPRSVHGLPRTYHRLGNHFGRKKWNS